MNTQNIQIGNKTAKAAVVELGVVNLVFAWTEKGFIGCGAFDEKCFDRLNYPAVKMRGQNGKRISTIDDLLEADVFSPNNTAKEMGINMDMNGRQVLEKF
jgi:uncharacterized protein YunC (DUF1805 family)